ncbi:MAG: hypothetical protein ACOX1S_12285 [Anaerostipes sp.]|jgi:Arc/MetJ-type ribon-helix-helix transcriptional regulator
MGKKREERRLASRFYLDDPNDKALLGKVDKMLEDREYKNFSEMIRKGIDLLYEDCYHINSNSKVRMLQMEVEYAAEEFANRILGQLDQRMEVHDAKIIGAISVCGNGNHLMESMEKEEKSKQVDEPSMEEVNSENLPEQTMSFLAGLNND